LRKRTELIGPSNQPQQDGHSNAGYRQQLYLFSLDA